MVFSGLFFLYCFFPLSLLAYKLCPTMKAKNISLLIFSLIFYAWGEPKYVLLLVAMSAFDWFFALKISQAPGDDESRRRIWLLLACAVDIGLIGWFKYSGMIADVFGEVPDFIENIALPIGISFYTFQLLTYVVDVYRGDAEVQKEFWHVLLYASLFHQCIAGPIVRYKSVAEELFISRDEFKDMPSGVLRFSTGLAKKVVLANTCGVLADKFLLTDAVISDASMHAANIEKLASSPALGLWLGLFAYAFQIYFDFSAYSDMAIGMGRMVGLHYLENFNYPYIARTVKDYWKRWHISLTSFFRDYVYIPLGGSRRGEARTYLNTFIVWALTGLWHGANWNYVLWGMYFFVFSVIEKLFLAKALDRLPGLLKEIVSRIYLLFTIMMSWILFRFTDMSAGLTVFKGLFGLNGNPASGFEALTSLKSYMYLLIFAAVCCTPLFRRLNDLWLSAAEDRPALAKCHEIIVYGVMPVALLLISTACLVGNSYNPFLYFRF